MKYLIADKVPVMFFNGEPLTEAYIEIEETAFWVAMSSAIGDSQKIEDKKEEITNHLQANSDHYIEIGDKMFKMKI